MAFSPAAKVGLATIVSVALIGAGLSWLTAINFGPKGYDFTVKYKDVSGLMNGAGVMLMGVRVGKVVSVEPLERMVMVHVHITSPKTKIESHARFKIMSPGIIGEKNIEIFPPKAPIVFAVESPKPDVGASIAAAMPSNDVGSSIAAAIPTQAPVVVADIEYLEPNAEVRGDDPERLELVMEDMTDTFNEFRKGMDPKKFQDLFAKTADNLVQTSDTIKRIGSKAEGLMGGFDSTPGRVNDMLASINRAANSTERLMGGANPTDLRAAASNFNQLSRNLLGTYGELFGNNAAVSSQQNANTARSVRSLAAQLDHLATTLNNTAGDPTMQSDIKDTIKNIKTLTQSFTGAASLAPKNVPAFGISPRVQAVAANTPDGTGIAANLGVRLGFGGNYFHGGLEQIGQGNYLDLGFGNGNAWNGVGYELGLIRSKIGVGVEYAVTDGISVSGDLYDPFHPTARIGATYFPIKGGTYGLLGQFARTFDQNANYIWLGVEWRPNF